MFSTKGGPKIIYDSITVGLLCTLAIISRFPVFPTPVGDLRLTRVHKGHSIRGAELLLEYRRVLVETQKKPVGRSWAAGSLLSHMAWIKHIGLGWETDISTEGIAAFFSEKYTHYASGLRSLVGWLSC